MKTKNKVPYVAQMQQTECGLCCVAMILRYYNSNETLSDLREYIEAGRDGLTINQLNTLVKGLNFSTKVFKSGINGLKQIKLPAILFWKNEHFVVLEGFNENTFSIVDPAFGRRKVTIKDFINDYSGYVISAQPNSDFCPKKKKKNIWLNFFIDLTKNKLLFIQLFLLSLVTYIVTLSVPVLVQHLIDDIVLKNRFDLLKYIILGVFLLVVIFATLLYIRGKGLIKLQVILDKTIMARTFLHILRVPYKFFEVRSFGDLLFRLNSLHVIRDLLSEQLIKGLIDIGALLFILGYMSLQSIFLTIIALALFILNGFFIIYTRPYILEANQYEIVENSKLQTIQVESLYSIFGIKTAGIEEVIFQNWDSKFNDVLDRFQRRAKIQNIYTTITNSIQTLAPFIILLTGIYLFFNKSISLGEVIAFYSLSGTFFSLSVSIFQTYNNFILTSAYLERVRDITDAEVEKDPVPPVEHELSGDIRLENVSFSYTKHSTEVVRNVTLHIESGQKIAIVGKSGSGKSTLSKILLGLYTPTAGNVLYDNINLSDFNKKELRKQMGVVPQDICLFNKSILENIKMNQQNVDLESVKRAAEFAQIASEIESMPMGYNTLVSEMGMNLSGGQRQRIALARALLSNPKIIILDEATSSLDAINEAKVSQHFKNIGCTRIVIAHRLSTIIDSDVIYVMDSGKIIESGTHETLMSKKGIYYDLYKTQVRENEKNYA